MLVGCGERGAKGAAERQAEIQEPVSTPTPAPTPAPLAATPPACPTAPKAEPAQVSTKAAHPKAKAAQGKLVIKRLVLAEAVKGREPVGAATTFKADEINKIYAFVEVENKDQLPGEIHVSFEPKGGGEHRGDIQLSVGESPRWRTWAYTRTARKPGEWSAVVRGPGGEELARAPFEITL